MDYYVDNDDNNAGSVHSKWNDRLRNIRITRIYMFRLHHKFIIDKNKKINKIVDKDKYVNHIISNGIPDDRKEFVLEALDKINHLSDEKEVSVKRVGIGSSDKEIPKDSTEKLTDHTDDIHKIPDDREEFVLGVLDDVRKSAPEREFPVKRVGIDSDDKDSSLEKIDTKVLIHLRDDFEDQMDELEVLEGELYSRDLDDNWTYVKDEVNICKKKVQVFIDKLDKLLASKKNQYDDIFDDTIEDYLYEYRMLLDSNGGYGDFSREYQKLDEYYAMYESLKNSREDVSRLKDKVNIITEKVDVDENIQDRLLNIDYINKSCANQIEYQNEYLDNLMKKIRDIDSSEYVTTHIRGFGELVRASFKYLGLLMLNPLKGTIPGIGIETLATKKLVGNLYQQLHLEKIKHIHYSAVNYHYELNSKIRDVEYVDHLLDSSLRDISKLKRDFKLKFDSSFPSFDSILDKINKIENTIVRNQNKVNKIKKRMVNSKKINEEKLMRIKKLNEH